MKANLKSRLMALPLLAFSTLTFAAEPVLLDAADMDRVTAGSQPVLERIANVLATVPRNPESLKFGELLALDADQLALLTQLASSEPISFRQLDSGDLVAIHQLQSGEKMVFFKQNGPVDFTSLPQRATGESVNTYLLNSGESLHVRQISTGESNYLYIYNPGSSTITTSQQTNL